MKHTYRSILCGFALATLASTALAADIANVRIINPSGEHAVEIDLDQLKVGESRQLVTASGLPAVVSRSEDGLSVEIAGKVTEVKLGSLEQHVWHADAGDGKHVRVIELDSDEVKEVADHDGHRKLVVVRKHEGEVSGMDEAEIADLVAKLEADIGFDGDGDADGEKVIVTRTIIHEQRD